jgi:hypothetical protein
MCIEGHEHRRRASWYGTSRDLICTMTILHTTNLNWTFNQASGYQQDIWQWQATLRIRLRCQYFLRFIHSVNWFLFAPNQEDTGIDPEVVLEAGKLIILNTSRRSYSLDNSLWPDVDRRLDYLENRMEQYSHDIRSIKELLEAHLLGSKTTTNGRPSAKVKATRSKDSSANYFRVRTDMIQVCVRRLIISSAMSSTSCKKSFRVLIIFTAPR